MTLTTIDVPPNTMIADLTAGLRELLVAQLRKHGFDDIEISFETPSSEWAGKLTRPTVNVFLCDLRKSTRPGDSSASNGRLGGRASQVPPGLRVDLSFAITSWSKAIADEHRLLSQVIGVLYAHPNLNGHLGGRLEGTQRFDILATVGEQRPEARADFWRSVGGTYKPALDYVVTLSVESGQVVTHGPDVRSVEIRPSLAEAPRRTVEEFTHVGGIVRDEDGPVTDAWVAVTSLGRVALSDDKGRFKIPRLAHGSYEVRIRARDGRETVATVQVPGTPLDVEMPGTRAGAA